MAQSGWPGDAKRFFGDPLSSSCENRIVLFQRDPKQQEGAVLTPDDVDSDVIISPDTRRAQRIPPGQSRTKKWPVLDASGPPSVNNEKWTLRLEGLVRNPVSWNLNAFLQ